VTPFLGSPGRVRRASLQSTDVLTVMKFSMLRTQCQYVDSLLDHLSNVYSLHPSSQSRTAQNDGVAMAVNDLVALYFQETSRHNVCTMKRDRKKTRGVVSVVPLDGVSRLFIGDSFMAW